MRFAKLNKALPYCKQLPGKEMPKPKFILPLRYIKEKAYLPSAAFWLQKSAEQGLKEAQYLLASMYYDGQGVEKDLGKAKYWYQKAAEQGNPYAIKALKDFSF